jgi:cell division protein ZapA (FtsZ GTPase activity inhibitor)
MPEINVELCGHKTTIACAAEDEERLRYLIGLIGSRAETARTIVGDNDRWRQLLFAAIFLADELDGTATDPVAGPTANSDSGNTASLQNVRRIAAALDRIESAVTGVEKKPANA